MAKELLQHQTIKGNAIADPFAGIMEALADRVAERVIERIEAAKPEPDYRDTTAECQRLDISISTLNRLCKEGMPHVYVGDSRRFKASAVDAYLAEQTARRGGE